MNWLQFISSLVGSIAWPAAVFAIAVLFRRVIVDLLPKLRKFKYGQVEAEFGDKLAEAELEVGGLPEPDQSPIKFPDEGPKLPSKGDYSNNTLVFLAWLEVEAAIFDLVRKHGSLRPNVSALQAARDLYGQQIVDKRTYQAIRELFDLRNIAVHPRDSEIIEYEEANRFQVLAKKITAILRER